MKRYCVIMAGGGGTRFWPLSRHTRPKQLLNLSGRDTMLNETIDRAARLTAPEDIYVVTNRDQAEAAEKVTAGRLPPGHILAEPAARNTAACIGYAALRLLATEGDGVMCVFPSDHFIRDEDAFVCALSAACACAEEEDCLVTLGLAPTFPCTGYGYIRYDAKEASDAKRVLAFREKPDAETARQYLDSGDYVWNSGMFVWKASVIARELQTHLPALYAGLSDIAAAVGTEQERAVLDARYPQLPSVSIDYGVMEKAQDVRVVPAEMGWSDVGTFDSFGDIHEADAQGNIRLGQTLALDTENAILCSGKRLIAALGVSDLVVVETEDAILVCDRARAQDVREVVDALKAAGRTDLL